ncbi:MAG: hemerythrin domain-containing protein [Thaumarchaeota archaeon]|nr:hemerythrin domain-containing protein [Nitrososphaerota archaeon]MDE1841004.1 hemerythrin domain-containing protein [Nitrososphaerota archaeon]MDE1877612.1 hemerythrin domain-containing protein [Nitrososphaerota archaeon]
MSGTEILRNDHRQIRRLEKIIVKCYSLLNEGNDVPFSDMQIMVSIMSEFLDAIHYAREENQYFPCVASYDSLKQEIRVFMIEHEFGRRIALNISKHLQRWKSGEDQRESVARFLKAYAVYLDDHLTKENKFFDTAEEQVLSPDEEKMMYEEFQAVTAVATKLDEMIKSIDYLESTPWAKD